MKATGGRKPSGSTAGDAPITGEDLERMPDLGPCELVRGVIVRASPTCREHGRVEVAFAAELRSFVKARGLGEVLAGETGIYTERGPDTVRGADVAFLSAERAARCRPHGFLDVAPDLVVEVLSPSEERAEVERKIEEYLAAGVRLVWVADPVRKTVRVCRPRVSGQQREGRDRARGDAARPAEDLVTGDAVLSGEDVLPGLELPLGRVFD